MSQKSEQKQRSHDAIVASAAALLRRRGIRASSVADVMRGAGLTVGGFYGHFGSKEELFAETIRSAASEMSNRHLGSAKGDSPRARALDVLRKYASRQHRDNPDQGCLLPGAAAEIAREGEPYRGALAAELGGFVRSLAALLGSGESGGGEGSAPESREEALGLIALMVGALSLARAVGGTPLSDDFLRAAKKLGLRMLMEDES
jgi:TetR/AcrR family transcriptional repressor of nem operon